MVPRVCREMSHRHQVFRLLAGSVRTRIFGGFAVVLALLAVLAVVALRSTYAVNVGAQQVETDSAEAEAATDVSLTVGNAHARAVQYVLSGSLGDQKAAQDSLTGVDRAIERSRATGADRARLAALANRYRQTVEATIAAVEARHAAIGKWQDAATDLHTIASAISQLLERESNADTIRAGMHLVDAFQTSDAAASRFIASRNPADLNNARSALQTFGSSIEAARGATTDNRRVQRLLGALADPQTRYVEGLRRIAAGDDALRNATIGRQAATDDVLRAAGEQRDAAIRSQRDAVGAMLAGIGSARQFGVLTSVGAIGIGLVLALLIGRSIARPIRD
jgi:CHASE3 domain sensor protein